MGEAKRRGTYEERVAMARAKGTERERLWDKKQKQQCEEQLRAEGIRRLMCSQLMVAVMLATTGVDVVTKE